MSKIVVALGGNALGNTPEEQLQLVRNTAKPIADIIEKGNQVIIAHGNGPQVGMINLAMEIASKNTKSIPEMPFPECGSMSQGYIGYHLQNAIKEELNLRNIEKSVVTVVTQVIVDENDKAFQTPSKPIGSFYSKEEAERIMRENPEYIMKEDAGRGYRRVVPSPMPVDIVEKESIQTLVNCGHIVITVGGGGIPVIKRQSVLKGVPAVIDKDYASEKLAEILDADYLIILTAVEKVCINYGKPGQKAIDLMSVDEVKRYATEGHFAPGSMLPKAIAASKFVESKKGRKALITSLEKALEGIDGKTGTLII